MGVCIRRKLETEITLMMVSSVICLREMMSPVRVLSLAKRICITLPIGEEILASKGILRGRKGEDTKAIARTFQAHSADCLRCSLALFGNGGIKIC
jgi:hypothetical protein